MNKFKVISEFTPKGDQPAAIKKLKNGIVARAGDLLKVMMGKIIL